MKVIGHPQYLLFRNGAILNTKTKRFLKATISSNKYLNIYLIDPETCKRKSYLLHRLLAIHFVANKDSKKYVDHIDRNRLNNSLTNLRWVTSQENNLNKGMYKNNTTGYRGIHVCTRDNKFRYLNQYYSSVEEIVDKFKLVSEV